MPLDFPNSPTNGQTYTDAGTGEQWLYEAATNSWTSKGLVNTSGGLQFKGSLDITAAPPTGVSSGWQYSSSTTGTPNAGFTGLSGTVNKGDVVMFTGTGWILQGHTVPDATAAVKGVVQLATAAEAGAATNNTKAVTPSTLAWKRTGTTLEPKTTGDVTATSAGTAALPGLTPVGDPDTGAWSPAANVYAISTGGAERVRWDANGSTVAALKGAEAANVIATKDGLLKRQPLPFTWDANDDSYIRTVVADRDISVQARMRRCLVADAGVVTYLDADDSTKLAGDWLRLCETTELSTAYTGTHGAEVANSGLRALAPAWAAGTFTKGALVTNGGFVWECVAATTTATPAAGTAAATLTGTVGQVMVEVPLFSIRHAAPKVGAYRRHELSVALGVVQGGGYVVHPAFVKPDGTYRNFFYVGAYQGTGTNGNGSASGVNNAVSFTRAAARAAMAGRGAGWHQMSYYQYSALAALLFAEYQDFESQRCLGNGAMTGNIYVVPTGLSNARGNRSANAHTSAGANSDYVSYRGVENIYGRAWQWVDGWNINERMCYLTGDPASFADNTAAKHQPAGMVPSGSAGFIRDIKGGAIFLADSVAGGSGATFTGDGLWTSSGWRVAFVGGGAADGASVGALCALLVDVSSFAGTRVGGRIAYSGA
jgi:hypothetical protein